MSLRNMNVRSIVRGLCLAISISALTACVTPRHKFFGNVQQGMEKDQVLEAAGSPNVSRRVKGQDTWLYIYRDAPGGTQTKEVIFENGRVVYAGDRRGPKISAEEQDRINDEINAADAATEAEFETERDEKMGVARLNPKTGKPSSKIKQSDIDRIERKISNGLYGTTDSIEEEKKKRAPVFEPVK